MHYEINDMCSNILLNIKNKSIKLSDKDKEIVNDDIIKILSWLKEKTYDEREDEEFEKIINSMKKKYTILIVKGNYEEDSNVKCITTENNGMTSIYGNDNNENSNEMNLVFEKLENEEMGFNGLTDPEKEELKELRKSINELCHDVFSITTNDNINISKEHLQELRDYIDDTLLWLHVHDKITKNEYIEKLNEINQNCDKIFNFYKEQNKDIFKDNNLLSSNKSKQEELENLCLILKLMIEENAFPIKDIFLEKLSQTIDDTLLWIYDDNKKLDIDNQQFYKECDNKINIINELSSNLHNTMQGIIINKENIIIPEKLSNNEFNFDIEKSEGGTSIIDLMQKNNNNIIEKMIIND